MKKAILDLCTRWGKTRTVLETFERSNSRILLMCSYIGTVRTSYRDEIQSEENYSNIKFFDPDNYRDDEDLFIERIKNHLNADEKNKVFYYVALTGDDKDVDFDSEESVEIDEGCFQRRTNLLKNFKEYTYDIIVEEVDFGASCEKQVKKLLKLANSVKCDKLFCTTGTNAEKALAVFADDEDLVYIKRDYILDVLNKRSGAVKINWNVLNNSEMIEQGYNPAEMENFSDMFDEDENGNLKGQIYFENLFNYLFNHELKEKDIRKKRALLNGTKNIVDTEAATMIFTPIGYDRHEKIAKVIEGIFGKNNVIVKIIDGKNTTNADAEEDAKRAIEDAKGRKVFFIASGMANRSFSVKQIKNIILLINDGSYSSIAQKIARAFTPWNEEHDTAYIIDFRFNYADDCMTKYFSRLGVDSISNNCLDKTTEEIEEVLETLEATDKLHLNEYFAFGQNPIRKLSSEEVSIMLHSRDFVNKQIENTYTEIYANVTDPKQCGINERDVKNKLANGNIKGDQKKVKISGKKGFSGLTDDEKKEVEIQNKKIQHVNFIINKFDIFNTGKYSSNILAQEIADINNDSELVKAYEDTFEIDMQTITDIVKIFTDHKINTDIFSKLIA